MTVSETNHTSVAKPVGQSRAARRLAAGQRLRSATDQVETEERQTALRALLMQPILPADGPWADSYRLVWRHAGWLRDWLTRMTGWTLVLQADLARLRKVPASLTDCTRPAIDPSSAQPLTRRRYALLCLVLAALENEDRQTTLEQVARRTQLAAGAEPRLRQAGFEFELTDQDCRRDMVCVIRFLQAMHVLARDDGDEQQFIRGTGDVLYRIDRPVLASLLCVARPPSTLEPMAWEERPAALHESELPDSDEARNRAIRHRLVRRLLEDPILVFDQLTEQELDYWTSQRAYLLNEITAATGLEPELRKEGVAMLDPRGDLTDIGLPEAGTRGHATLLIAEWFADRLRSGDVAGVSWTEMDERMGELIEEHGEHWKKGVDQPASRELLAHEVVDRLEALGLLEIRRGTVAPRPAIARYALVNDPPE